MVRSQSYHFVSSMRHAATSVDAQYGERRTAMSRPETHTPREHKDIHHASSSRKSHATQITTRENDSPTGPS